MSIFKDAGHLFRFAALFVIGTLTFLGIRGFFVPKSFGEYGHYRGNAIAEIAARPIHLQDTRPARPATRMSWIRRRMASMRKSIARHVTVPWQNMPTTLRSSPPS